MAIVAVTPSVVAISVFVYILILWTGIISVVNWNDVAPNYTFIGLRNYQRLFETDRFLLDLQHNGLFALLFLTQSIVIGFLLAVLLDQRTRGEPILRTIYILPFAVSQIVTGVAWKWLMYPDSGLNVLFSTLGLGFLHSSWFADRNFGIAAVTIASTWQMSGYVMALYLAGLRGIPTEMREAASIDGASPFHYYRYIAIPQMAPVTATVVIILGAISLRLFDMIASMTSGGPAYRTDTLAYYMFESVFQQNYYSRGAAIAVVMLLLAAFLIVPYLRRIRMEVDR